MLNHPLQLAVGSHPAGTGKGCAMNVISWENGDTTITDLPECSDPLLARVVQRVNDRLCIHRDDDTLCPECSQQVLALAHRTVGTGSPLGLNALQRRQVWVLVAADQARCVLDLAGNRELAEASIRAAEAWAKDPTEANRAAAAVASATKSLNIKLTSADRAAMYAAESAVDYAAKAVLNDVNSAADVKYAEFAACDAVSAIEFAQGPVNAEYAAVNAVMAYDATTDAADNALYAIDAAGAAVNAVMAYDATTDAVNAAIAIDAANAVAHALLGLAHRAISTFQRHTGHTNAQPDAEELTAALTAMQATR